MHQNSKPLGSLFARTALALVLAAGVASAAPAFAKDTKAPAQAKPSNSPEFVKVAGPFQKELAALDAMKGKATDAEIKAATDKLAAEIPAVEAVTKTPSDRLILGQWQYTLAARTSNKVMAQSGLQNMLDSGQMPADKIALIQFNLGISAYQNNDYAAAIKTLTPVVAANYPDDVAAEALALSYSSQNQTAEALNAIKTAATVRAAAGGAVPAQWLLRANQIAYKSKNPAWGNEWAILTVKYAPTPANWISSAQLLRIYNGYTSQEALDLARLLSRSGALTGNVKEARQEYLDYISTADARRQPGEVLSVIAAATSSGALSATDPAVTDAKALANQRLPADKAALPKLYSDAHLPASSAAGVAGTADAFLGYGDSAKAVELYKIALTKPGVDAPRTLTRLGIAQLDAGDTAGARDSFSKVTGSRQPLAQFWLAYVDQKAAAPK